MGEQLKITEEAIAAAQLRLVIDEKLGRATPQLVRQIASMTAGSTAPQIDLPTATNRPEDAALADTEEQIAVERAKRLARQRDEKSAHEVFWRVAEINFGPERPEEDPPPSGMLFEVFVDSNEMYRVRIRSSNSQTLTVSEAFPSKADAVNAAKSMIAVPAGTRIVDQTS